MAIQESHIHYVIIALLGISIILLGVHINQMKKKERFGTTQAAFTCLSGVCNVGGQAQPLVDYISGATTTVTDALNNPMVGALTPAEDTTSFKPSSDDYYM